MKKACNACHRITEESNCPGCGGTDLSNRWTGMAIIIDPENSEVAKRLEITKGGVYALRVE